MEAYDQGRLKESFGTGTAAVISPIGELKCGDKIMTINNGSNVTESGRDGNTSYLVTFNPNNGKLSIENEEKSWKLLGDFNGYSSYASDMIIRFDGVEKEWYLVPEIGEEKTRISVFPEESNRSSAP